jgi:hypothetical protein
MFRVSLVITNQAHLITFYSIIKAISGFGGLIVVTFTTARVKQEIAKEGICHTRSSLQKVTISHSVASSAANPNQAQYQYTARKPRAMVVRPDASSELLDIRVLLLGHV